MMKGNIFHKDGFFHAIDWEGNLVTKQKSLRDLKLAMPKILRSTFGINSIRVDYSEGEFEVFEYAFSYLAEERKWKTGDTYGHPWR